MIFVIFDEYEEHAIIFCSLNKPVNLISQFVIFIARLIC